MPADLLARHLAASLRHPGSSFATFFFPHLRKSTGTQKHSRKTNNEKVVVKPYLPSTEVQPHPCWADKTGSDVT